MTDQNRRDQQDIDNAAENSRTAAKSGISEPFISQPLKQVVCVICDTTFESRAGSSANACSEACRRERRLRYGAQYRQMGREANARMLAMFGGRRPTESEILEFLRNRKEKP